MDHISVNAHAAERGLCTRRRAHGHDCSSVAAVSDQEIGSPAQQEDIGLRLRQKVHDLLQFLSVTDLNKQVCRTSCPERSVACQDLLLSDPVRRCDLL